MRAGKSIFSTIVQIISLAILLAIWNLIISQKYLPRPGHQPQEYNNSSHLRRAQPVKLLQSSNKVKGIHNGTEPSIDAVFTYVNGSDPELILQIENYGRRVSPRRFRDFGQLRYAMRSVLMHAAPFIRNFIVVVSSKQTQIPSWLNSTHPRVRVVEHSEIWDNPSYLPSMNSEAIEWSIMNIPDLSPQYLYLNDDFAVTKKLDLATLQPGPNKYVVWEAWEVRRSHHRDEYGKSLAFVRKLYDTKYGHRVSRRVASHVPLLMDIATQKKIKDDFPKEFEDMYRDKPFRTNHTMQFQFSYQQYIRHFYPFVRAPTPHVYFEKVTGDTKYNEMVFAQIRSKPRQYMCVQDGLPLYPLDYNVTAQIHTFYEKMFPVKGPWERETV